GLDSRVRDERQKKWKEGYLRIIVATNAFGMGIDKDNVRFVVHLDLPNNPEAYFQEAGRGGRDGKKAFSIILWEDADINNLYKYFKLSYPPIETIKQTYTALGNYFQIATGAGAGQNFTFNIIHFAKQYDKNPIVIYNSLKFLENQGLIIMSDAMHRPSKIRIDMNGNDLYRFQVSHPSFDNLIKYFLRNHPGLYQNFVAINETHLLKTFNITQEQLRSSLKKLVHLEVLSYEAESNTPMITFAIPRLATKDFYISKEVYDRRKTTALTRLKAIISYVETENKCRSQLLLSYFGEKDSKRCGQCDVCLERNKTQLSELEFDDIVKHIKPLLKNKPLAIDELVFETSYGDANRLLQAIQWLQDNGKITEDKDHILHWAE
ncbi:MAG: recombinase RecQ, partial [Bacteroidetes bacterium 4572_77]